VNRNIIQRDERRGECGPNALVLDYPSPSDHGCSIRGLQDIKIEGYKTLKQIWGGIAINVKRAVIPDIFA
jgi:hypothetical protein